MASRNVDIFELRFCTIHSTTPRRIRCSDLDAGGHRDSDAAPRGCLLACSYQFRVVCSRSARFERLMLRWGLTAQTPDTYEKEPGDCYLRGGVLRTCVNATVF